MSQISFSNFAQAAARTDIPDTEIAGRYAFQAHAERLILGDVIGKLALQPEDRLLEIGCGPGNLLIPLSHFVSTATGIDNAPLIERLLARAPLASNLKGISGDFLDSDLAGQKFDKVLIYSVLHYLSSREEILRFVDHALELCSPGGRILLGDLPNRQRKQRFAASAEGQHIREQWEHSIAVSSGHPFDRLPADNELVTIDDELVLEILRHVRTRGQEAYILPQPTTLPFGGSREDILITVYHQSS